MSVIWRDHSKEKRLSRSQPLRLWLKLQRMWRGAWIGSRVRWPNPKPFTAGFIAAREDQRRRDHDGH